MGYKVIVINGPNLNMLGQREPEVYGADTLEDIEARCVKTGKALKMDVTCFQTNYEGEMVELIQKAHGKYDGIVLNAAAYTHTSLAIHDAIKAVGLPVIEVHLSNVYAREEFRHHSFVSPVAKGVLCGFGPIGYSLALTALKDLLDDAE